MVEIVGKTYRNCTVNLDGRHFVRCRFFDCVLLWRGLQEFELDAEQGVELFDTTIRCEGAAKGAEEGIYLGLWRNAKVIERRDDECRA